MRSPGSTACSWRRIVSTSGSSGNVDPDCRLDPFNGPLAEALVSCVHEGDGFVANDVVADLGNENDADRMIDHLRGVHPSRTDPPCCLGHRSAVAGIGRPVRSPNPKSTMYL